MGRLARQSSDGGSRHDGQPGRSSEQRAASGYWLRNSEGFRVDSSRARLGIVEHVLVGPSSDLPDALVVRAGLLGGRLVLVPVDEVEEVRPRERRIVLRPRWRPAERDFLSELLGRLRALATESLRARGRAGSARSSGSRLLRERETRGDESRQDDGRPAG